MDLLDLKEPNGEDNDPGLRSTVWCAPMQYFAKPNGIKDLKKTSQPGDSVTIDGSHAFLANKGFHPLYTTADTQNLKLESTGERDGRGKKGTLTFFHPGSKKEAAEFDRRVKNLSCILLVQTPDGDILQIGGKGRGAEVLGAFDSGTNSGGRRGFTFTVEYFTSGLVFYEGEVKEFDGTIAIPAEGATPPEEEEPVGP